MSKKYHERFVELGWKILECKAEYYGCVDLPTMTDEEYDKIEDEYRGLAKKLNMSPTAADMVGFDLYRPSCRLVMNKLMKVDSQAD